MKRETKEGEEETFDRERFEKEWDDSVIHDVEEAKKRGFETGFTQGIICIRRKNGKRRAAI